MKLNYKKQPTKNPTTKNKVLKFGKYKNYLITRVPTEYLIWCVLNLNDNHRDIPNITEELKYRKII